MLSLLVLFLTLSVVFIAVLRLWQKQPAYLPLPGPKGWPIIGNLLDMPTRREWLKYSEWRKIYGDVFQLNVLGQSIVVVNSAEAAETLLEKRNSIYSDRPRMALLTEWCKCDWFITTQPYGEHFHAQRKLMNQHLNPTAMKDHVELVYRNVIKLADQTLSAPADFQQHNLRMVGSISLMLTYGHKVESNTDALVFLLRDTLEMFAKMSAAGAHPVDLLPFLSKLPPSLFGAQFARDIQTTAQHAEKVLNVPYGIVKNQMASGTAPSCIVASQIRSATLPDGSIHNEDVVKGASAMIYLAGADTTVAALDTFILAMMLYPAVQRKAQAELEGLLGGTRLPTYEDRESCTYLEAVLKELHRWNPVGPLALPHRVMVDDTYQGMLIPGGSVVIANSWEILHDPDLYPNPSLFSPDRFLVDGILNPEVQDPKRFAFGYGRRICPGRHLAEAILWTSMAVLLAVFDISLPIDENGVPIYPDLEFESSVAVSRPKPYKAHFVPRSKAAMMLLEEASRMCE